MDHIRISKISVSGRRGTRLFITSVRFADGAGYQVKSFSYTADASKAATFSRASAESIAQQLCGRCVDVRVVRPNEMDTLFTMNDAQLGDRRAAHLAAREINSIAAEALRIVNGYRR